MTSNKDLEKRMTKKLNDRCPPTWWHIIAMTGAILGAIALFTILFTPTPQYTTASPCELGLMEWEYEIKYTEDFEEIRHLPYYTPNYGCKVFIRDRCGLWYYESEKSCPYSGPDIMVVKE